MWRRQEARKGIQVIDARTRHHPRTKHWTPINSWICFVEEAFCAFIVKHEIHFNFWRYFPRKKKNENKVNTHGFLFLENFPRKNNCCVKLQFMLFVFDSVNDSSTQSTHLILCRIANNKPTIVARKYSSDFCGRRNPNRMNWNRPGRNHKMHASFPLYVVRCHSTPHSTTSTHN